MEGLAPVLQYLSSKTEVEEEVRTLLSASIPLIFATAVEELTEHYPIEVQATDRFAQTQLVWRMANRMEVNDDEDDIISRLFALLSSFPYKEVPLALMKVLAEKVDEWSQLSDDDVMALRGLTLLNGPNLLWRIRLLTEAFSYLQLVSASLYEEDKLDEEEEDASCSSLLPLKHEEEDTLTTCTFVNTNKEFSKQHWYNCHTCGMVETVGVCSVCAVNCHRGHDLSYSKYGSFFCDCGERGCEAMNGAPHPLNKSAPQYSQVDVTCKLEEEKRQRSLRAIHAQIHSVHNMPAHLKEAVKKVEECMSKVCSVVEAMESASEGKWGLEGRRKDARDKLATARIKYDECIMVARMGEEEWMSALEMRSDTLGEWNGERQCCGAVQLRDHSNVVLFTNGSTALTLIRSFDDFRSVHVEKVELPYAATRVNVCEGYVFLLCPPHEVVVMRLDVQGDGKLVYRCCRSFYESAGGGALVGVAWAPFAEPTLVVAAQQLLRTYRVVEEGEWREWPHASTTLLSMPFQCELLLPHATIVQFLFIHKDDSDTSWLLVLASTGLLYYYHFGGPSPHVAHADTNNSLFLTNTIDLPEQGDAVSMHYSHSSSLLFISLSTGLWVAHVGRCDDIPGMGAQHFKRLSVNGVDAVKGWNESCGVISALSLSSSRLLFFYPTLDDILVQSSHLMEGAMGVCVMKKSSSDSTLALLFLSTYRSACVLFHSNWLNEPDMWIEELPRKEERLTFLSIPHVDTLALPKEELITLFEKCLPMEDVVYSCEQLQLYYDDGQLGDRLKTIGKKTIAITNVPELRLRLTIGKKNDWIVRGMRVEVDSSASNVGATLTVLGETVEVNCRHRRTYDIPFTEAMLSRREKGKEVVVEMKMTATGQIFPLLSLVLVGQSKLPPQQQRRAISYPLYLPSRLLLSLLRLLVSIRRNSLAQEDGWMEWWRALSLRVSCGRWCRSDVTLSARRLLSFYTPDESACRECVHESVLVALMKMSELSSPIPPILLKRIVMDMRECMSLSPSSFLQMCEKQMSGGADQLAATVLHMMSRGCASEGRGREMLVSLYVHIVSLLLRVKGGPDELIVQLLHCIASSSMFAYHEIIHATFLQLASEQSPTADDNGWKLRVVRTGMAHLSAHLRLPSVHAASHSPSIYLLNEYAHVMRSSVSLLACLLKTCPSEQQVAVCVELLEENGGEGKGEQHSQLLLLSAFLQHMMLRENRTRRKRVSEKEEGEECGMEECPYSCSPDMAPPIRQELSVSPHAEVIVSQCTRILHCIVREWGRIAEWENSTYTHWFIEGVSGRDGNWVYLYHSQLVRGVVNLLGGVMKRLPEDQDDPTIRILCEVLLIQPSMPARRHAKKLLLHLCANDKETYKKLKDRHTIVTKMNFIRLSMMWKRAFTHEEETDLLNCVRDIVSVVRVRAHMWSELCEDNAECLLHLATRVSDTVAFPILQLIQAATRVAHYEQSAQVMEGGCGSIADNIVTSPTSHSLLTLLLLRYLVGRDEKLRWLMHSITRSLMQLARRVNQLALLSTLREVAEVGRGRGVAAAQVVDLVAAYAPSLLSPQQLLAMGEEELLCVERACERVRSGGALVAALTAKGLSSTDALALSSNSCPQCLPVSPQQQQVAKLNNVKVDAKYLATAQLIKLNAHYEIVKVIVRLSEVKRNRIFSRVNLLYWQKTIDNVLDLKEKESEWKRLATATLGANETEVSLSIPIPLFTNAIVIQFADFPLSPHNAELHCPRCSSLVPPNPGVCPNCGENAYQCIKCRVINYDEREPFLCSSCGFCKHARIDVTIVSRQHTRVIMENKDEGTKTLCSALNALHECESRSEMVRWVCECIAMAPPSTPNTLPVPLHSSSSAVQCLNAMPSVPIDGSTLSAMSEWLKWSRRHDERRQEAENEVGIVRESVGREEGGEEERSPQRVREGECVGCAHVSLLHSLFLLRSLCEEDGVRELVLSSPVAVESVGGVGGAVPTLRREWELLMVRLCGRGDAEERVCAAVRSGRADVRVLVAILTLHPTLSIPALRLLLQMCMEEKGDQASFAFISVLLHWLQTPTLTSRMNVLRTSSTTSSSSLGVHVGDVQKVVWKCVFSPLHSLRNMTCKLVRMLAAVPLQRGLVVSLLLKGLHVVRGVRAPVMEQFFLTCNVIVRMKGVRLRLFLANFHLHLLRLIVWECGRSDPCHHLQFHLSHLLCSMLCSGRMARALLAAASPHIILPLLQSVLSIGSVHSRSTAWSAGAYSALQLVLKEAAHKDASSVVVGCVMALAHVKDAAAAMDAIHIILNTINPNNKVSDAFLVQIEKDAAQEDFLQGRMQGNPYSSSESSMGPLMRNMKDKICRESELVALLEDDNSMELIVNGKIVSLSLPVKLVYDKLWRRERPTEETMVVVYRMRGLLGDATEPFVQTLDDDSEGGEGVSEGEGVLVSAVLRRDGVSLILHLLHFHSCSPHNALKLLKLIQQLVKTLVKVKSTRDLLISKGAIERLLECVKRWEERKEGKERSAPTHSQITHILLDIILLLINTDNGELIGKHPMSASLYQWLLTRTLKKATQLATRPHDPQMEIIKLIRVTANVGIGCVEAEGLLVKEFAVFMSHMEEVVQKAATLAVGETELMEEKEQLTGECLALILHSLIHNHPTSLMKDRLNSEAQVIQKAVSCMLCHVPAALYGTSDSTEWGRYLKRPSLRLVLMTMRGMATAHAHSQLEIALHALPVLHRLEQVSSTEHVGPLAETVMDKLKENPQVAVAIEKVRLETKQKKKQLAMAMRKKQLSAMGMEVGRAGQLKVARRWVGEEKAEEDEEPLTACCICRESVLQGTRVAAVYAYAYPSKSNPSHLHSSSLMVVVHCDCHYQAIRRSTGGRSADEWTKAALHNSGGRTNNLVPIVVNGPSSSDWKTAVQRLQMDWEAVGEGGRGTGLTRCSVLHHMCGVVDVLLGRGGEEAGMGGGRESNVQYLAILHLLALSLPAQELTTSDATSTALSFLLTVHTVAHWREEKDDILAAMFSNGTSTPSHTLTLFAFLHLYFTTVIPIEGEDRLEWLKANIKETLKRSVSFLSVLDEHIVRAASDEHVAAYCGVSEDLLRALSAANTPQ